MTNKQIKQARASRPEDHLPDLPPQARGPTLGVAEFLGGKKGHPAGAGINRTPHCDGHESDRSPRKREDEPGN